jgi:hypothetical protein
MWLGAWIGIMVISLVNIVLIVANRNQFLYDGYIFGVSVIVVIVIKVMKSRSKI